MAFYNTWSSPSFIKITRYTNLTFLNLSIVNVKNFFLQISFRKLKSKYEIILGWSFDVRDCFLCVHRFLEVAVGFCCFEYEKPAKNRFFKLFVISPVQWIAWTQNYFSSIRLLKGMFWQKEKKFVFFMSVLRFRFSRKMALKLCCNPRSVVHANFG